jgi:hypothetical protein
MAKYRKQIPDGDIPVTILADKAKDKKTYMQEHMAGKADMPKIEGEATELEGNKVKIKRYKFINPNTEELQKKNAKRKAKKAPY